MSEDKHVGGTWPADCQQRAFVDGASWARYAITGFTPFPTERDAAEAEAVRRYGEPAPRAPDEAAGVEAVAAEVESVACVLEDVAREIDSDGLDSHAVNLRALASRLHAIPPRAPDEAAHFIEAVAQRGVPPAPMGEWYSRCTCGWESGGHRSKADAQAAILTHWGSAPLTHCGSAPDEAALDRAAEAAWDVVLAKWHATGCPPALDDLKSALRRAWKEEA